MPGTFLFMDHQPGPEPSLPVFDGYKINSRIQVAGIYFQALGICCHAGSLHYLPSRYIGKGKLIFTTKQSAKKQGKPAVRRVGERGYGQFLRLIREKDFLPVGIAFIPRIGPVIDAAAVCAVCQKYF